MQPVKILVKVKEHGIIVINCYMFAKLTVLYQYCATKLQNPFCLCYKKTLKMDTVIKINS